MKRIWTTIRYAILALMGAFFFALSPVWLQATDGHLSFLWRESFETIQNYIVGLGNGDSFLFEAGSSTRHFFAEIGSYAIPSMLYVLIAAVVSVVLGLLGGMLLLKRKLTRELLEALVMIPDFVVIILLQLFVVVFYKSTGILLARVATFISDEPAIALPLISMIIVPMMFIMRNVSVHSHEQSTGDYIRTAKAKGFGSRYIILKHVFPNVLPFIKADLPKFIGIILGNLFIVEYLYNVHGITKLLLSSGFGEGGFQKGAMSGYQFPLVLNCLFTLMIVYAVTLLIVQSMLKLMEGRRR